MDVSRLNELIGILFTVLALIGAILCYRYRRLSRQLTLVGIGFLCGIVAINLNYLPTITFLIPFGMLNLFAPLLNLFAAGLVLFGLYLTLEDLSLQINALRRPPLLPPPDFAEDDLGHWRPHRSGSRDIQE